MADSTKEDLKAPFLLPLNNNNNNNNHEYIIDISNANGEGGGLAFAEDVRNPSPFGFLGPSAAELSLPRPTPIDPFRNRTPNAIAGIGLYGWVKLVVIVPVALIRLAIYGLALAVGYLATKLALAGWKDRQSPMPAWRCRIMWITRICSRCILFSFGSFPILHQVSSSPLLLHFPYVLVFVVVVVVLLQLSLDPENWKACFSGDCSYSRFQSRLICRAHILFL